ncbi:nitroreductase family protein [Isachenkonia alkalipeptolytica]|nr:nitroreductase family protein [Isachenkonia alkalipeptolytica]
MNINFSIEEAVEKRVSVRNYVPREVEPDTRKEVEGFIASLSNPFKKEVEFHFLDAKAMEDREKLGTYGVIKGAKQYIGTTIKDEAKALEALGYEMEVLMLYLAHKGLGTCWLGGTFNRKGFAGAMNIKEDELFPIITPYGYPAENKHLKERAMRKLIKADQRKKWQELFFNKDFQTPLPKVAVEEVAFPLEMVRLGPSASNKQPWRILRKNNAWHFYEYKEPGYSKYFSYDIQRVDMGIAAAHFDLALREKGIEGAFDTEREPAVELPEHMEYAFSWIAN